MKKMLLLLAGILFAALGYYLGVQGNEKWTISFLFVIAAGSFLSLAWLMVKHSPAQK
ncbi:hypothetical protein KH172YL63_22770 [Bacillus sp. KH172YL63]|nr:hypothetical protein KH172YL63_22770 [Bacillus sp. KH172YL63]